MKDRHCPRDRSLLRATEIGEVTLDVCGKCEGTFFDSGEMLNAFGQAADLAAWDRPETGGSVKPSELPCPRCNTHMHAQEVSQDGRSVEIDRCGKCRGVWLDKGEIDTIVAIGHAMQPLLEAERARAREEVAALGRPSFATPWNKKAIAAVLLVVSVVVGALYYASRPAPRDPDPDSERGSGTRAKGEEGCPCGCDRSTAMAAALREQSVGDAAQAIDETLSTIAARENVGYITERMIQHRLRMRALASDLHVTTRARPSTPSPSREAITPVEAAGMRVAAELVVHGERIEIVNGEEKLITPSFRLWLRIENTTDRARDLAVPSLRAAGLHLPVSRWYLEGTDGTPWSGALAAHGVVRVLVIGDIPEHLRPGAHVAATVSLDSLELDARADARGTIEF